jgi:TolA-binding protein
MSLKDEKIDTLHDKIAHLEEKLEIAKSAARAAAQAAQSAKNPSIMSPTHLTSPSMTFAQGTGIPEKISPQALRESIMVLQDQLQQREGRIEELEHEISTVDKDAPNKLKERETEVNWLRELLDVRIDDLQDIVSVLSQPSFNHHAVRDAAIRLKANLQMQQQERERARTGGTQPFPSLASLSNIASPRGLPLAAAAAWGNWRKGRENSVTSTSSSGHLANGDNDQTPSKAPTSTSQGFFTGLMTPPSSNIRQMPNNQSAPPLHRPFRESRPLRPSSGAQRGLSLRQAGKQPQTMEPPKTPPLLRKSSYDHDAQATNYEDGSYMDEENMLGPMVPLDAHEGSADGPFGPAI